MLDKNRKRKENNRLRDQRKENQEEARKAIIATQQSITQNKWRGLDVIFNSLITYQVLQLVKEEAVITIVQTNVEEVNGLQVMELNNLRKQAHRMLITMIKNQLKN